jgi:hypothetical protein
MSVRPDVGQLVEAGALSEALEGVAHLQAAVAEPESSRKYHHLRQAVVDLRHAAQIAELLAKSTKPPAPPRAPKPPREPGRYVVVTSSEIGSEVGHALRAARERAGLDERVAARTCGLSLTDYREFEAGTKRCRMPKAERVAAVPWVGPELGERLVAAVRDSIEEQQRAVDEKSEAAGRLTPSQERPER